MQLLVFFIFIFAHSAAAESNDCGPKYAMLVDHVFKPNEGLLKDLEPSTYDPYWGRLSQAFQSSSSETLEKLFRGPNRITTEDINKMWFDCKAGILKCDAKSERFLDSLYEFVSDHPNIFNGGGDQAYQIVEAFKRADLQHGFSGERDAASKTTTRALNKAEATVVAQALREQTGGKNASTKWYDSFLNFFSPHFNRAKSFIGFNNNLRESMQRVYAAVEPVDDALAKYADKLNVGDKTTLGAAVVSGNTQLENVRGVIKNLYGQELTSMTPLKEGQLRIRSVGNQVKTLDSGALVAQSEVNAINNLDTVDNVISDVRSRNNLGPRPWEEYHPRHLEIRNTQHANETRELRAAYAAKNHATVRNSEYDVRADWTVTVQHQKTVTKQRDITVTDNDGNMKTEVEDYLDTETWTTSYTMSDRFTLNANYHEVLGGKITPSESRVDSMLPSAQTRGADAVSASNGSPTITWVDQVRTSSILSAATKAREIEKPLQLQIESAVDQIAQIRNKYPQNIQTDAGWKAALKQVDEIKAALVKSQKERLEEYRKLSDATIQQNWVHDDIAHFKSRNELQNQRFLHMSNRIAHFREQIRRRVKNLELVFDQPNYTETLNELARIHKRNRLIQGVGAGTIAAGAGGATYYMYDDQRAEGVKQKFNELKQKVFGIEKNIPANDQPPN